MWLADHSPGETRLAQVVDGQIIALRLLRDADGPQPGDIYGAILQERLSAQLFVAQANGIEIAVGPVPMPLGSRLALKITRAAIEEPGGFKRPKAVWIKELKPDQMGRIQAAPVPDFMPVPVLDGADEVIAQALAGSDKFPWGNLSFERTRAGLVIDVDGLGDPLAVNLAAAQAIPPRLHLYGVGGPVLIDFIGLESKAARAQVDQAFENAAQSLKPFERTALNGFGLMQLVRPKTGPSLLDQLMGSRRSGASIATQGYLLLREAVRSQGPGERRLIAPPAVAQWLADRPDLLEEARKSTGYSTVPVPQSNLPGYGYVHVQRP
jgi:ribonuclease G